MRATRINFIVAISMFLAALMISFYAIAPHTIALFVEDMEVKGQAITPGESLIGQQQWLLLFGLLGIYIEKIKKIMFKEEDIRYVQTSDGGYPDEKRESVMFTWSIDRFGFGTTTFYYRDDKLRCDNEAMSKESIKKILCKFVDEAEFDS